MKSIIKNPLFYILIILKIFVLFFINSTYTRELFYPFISSFDFNNNPWDNALMNKSNIESFPYHGCMLYLLKFFQIIGLSSKYIQFNFFTFKIVLLIADILMLYILCESLRKNYTTLLIIYFANPIMLYATYTLGQLDIIPMSLLMLSLLKLKRGKNIQSALILGLSLATKLNILAVIPLIFLYLKKRQTLGFSLLFVSISLMVLLLMDLPFLFSEGFFKMVINNQKQLVIFDTIISIKNLEIYPTLLALMFLYFHFYSLKKVNFDLLYTFIGILFSIIVLFIFPVPSWYIWFLPFFIIYFSNNIKENYILHIIFSIVYILFFVFCYKSENINLYFIEKTLNIPRFNLETSNMIFTILEAMLIIILYGFYKFGIKSNSLYKSQLNFVIGIAGDSGAGKTLLTEQLKNLFKSKLLHLEGDGEHKWERGNKNWDKLTHLDPRANNIHDQACHIINLKENVSISRADYNHSSGRFTEIAKVKPKEYIALSGLHPFYLPKMRKTIDLKIYLDTDEELRNFWKIKRDTKIRGYSVEKILEQINERKEDAIKYIKPQKNFSDLIFNYYPIKKLEYDNLELEPKIGLKIFFDANLQIDKLINSLSIHQNWDYSDDLKFQYICFENEPHLDFKKFAEDTIPNLYEIIPNDSNWLKGFQGLVQFFVLLLVSEKRKKSNETI
jgi:uridine kinase